MATGSGRGGTGLRTGASQPSSVAESLHIVVSKVCAPRLRPGLIRRPQLTDGLADPAAASVVLLSAPPGYGKSTVLALWRESDDRPFAWATLDESDNDPIVLVRTMFAAFDQVMHLGELLPEDLLKPNPSLDEVVLADLLNACVASDQPCVLVLDDLHRVVSPDALGVVEYVIDHLPAGFQVALATRSDPALPLASMRMHGRLAELRSSDLAYDVGEASAMLEAAGLDVRPDLVEHLVSRTEGWPAGLYLAALSLRGRDDQERFVHEFAGTSRHVADFLSEDVLARQPAEVRDFLLLSSVLDELTGPSCDAVTRRDDAEDALRTLEESNLFVVPLDEQRRTYRYHHLFAQYLRAELARRSPALVPELHRRAWHWYREHGLVQGAISHATAAGDHDVAAEMVASRYRDLAEHGYVETIRGWVAAFEPAFVEQHPPLAIVAAWCAALGGDPEAAARFTAASRAGTWSGPMPDGTASLESCLALLTAAAGTDGLKEMLRQGELAVRAEQPPSRHRALALELYGIALTLGGDTARGREMLIEAVRRAEGQRSTRALSLAQLAVISLRENCDDDALAYAEQARAIVDSPRMRSHLSTIATHAVCARVLAQHGDFAGAEGAVDHAMALLPRLSTSFWWLMIETRVLLAPVLARLGRTEEAVGCLHEVDDLLAAYPDAGDLPGWAAEAGRLVQGRRRQLREAQDLSDAERRILRLLASDLTLREIGSELCLSVNTVKTHTHAIYRKLGVSSRAQAVTVGRATNAHAAASATSSVRQR